MSSSRRNVLPLYPSRGSRLGRGTPSYGSEWRGELGGGRRVEINVVFVWSSNSRLDYRLAPEPGLDYDGIEDYSSNWREGWRRDTHLVVDSSEWVGDGS